MKYILTIIIASLTCFQVIQAQLTVSTINGNVGIKDSSPEEVLTITGNVLLKNSSTRYLKFRNAWGGSLSSSIDKNGIFWNVPNQAGYGADTIRFYQLYNYGQDKMFFDTDASYTNGALLTIEHDGNVGIGTTTPAKALHVESSVAGGLRLTRSGSSCVLDAGANINEAVIGTTSNHNFRFLTNNAVRMQIQANGNVGIGTTNPLNKFQVNGDALFNSSVGKLKFGYPASSGWGYATTGGGATLYLSSYTTTSTEEGSQVRVTFRNNGTNGFGTISPAKVLHAEASGAGGALRITRSGTSVVMDAGSEFNEAFIGTTSNHNFRFLTSGAVRMQIQADGKVGIGTTSPSFPLEVAGDAYITGDLTVASDRNVKKKIRPLGHALTTIRNLNPVSFYYRVDEFPSMKLSEKKKMGLIAQELESVLPELVYAAGTVKNTQGQEFSMKSVNYLELIPLMVKAIQELENEIRKRDVQIETLSLQLAKVEELANYLESIKASIKDE